MTPPIDVAINSEESRWRVWKEKGRADELRFQGRLRTVIVDVAAVIALGAAVWSAFRVW